MRVLVLGASGMLGHRVASELAARGVTVVATAQEGRQACDSWPGWLRAPTRWESFGVDVGASVASLLAAVRPDAVVNCIGIVKQRSEAKSAVLSISVNALFPNYLADACRQRGARLVLLSTDCVFSGRNGSYNEKDEPDPVDLYGRTKLLGEVAAPGCLTLRTSIVGWELRNRVGLLEWFARQRGRTVFGYRKAIYSGLSTQRMALLIADLLGQSSFPDGVWHVSSDPISKLDLLSRLQEELGWSDISIEPDNAFQCDRSLDSTRFRRELAWNPPPWDAMIHEMAAEWPSYAGERGEA